MKEDNKPTAPQRWALLRFSVVGPLLAAPPPPGGLERALRELAERTWRHPVTGEPLRLSLSTVERWYYQAKGAGVDPVRALRKKVRQDAGQQRALPQALREVLAAQYASYPHWNYQLHYDNLKVQQPSLVPQAEGPSYSTVRRYMRAQGLVRQPRKSSRDTAGVRQAQARLAEREVRSYQVEQVNGLWHLDFHVGSLPVLNPRGEWVKPCLYGSLDDASRVVTHVQWYWAETAENLVHGLGQGLQKWGLPRAIMTDNGPAETALEVEGGMQRLGIVHELTLPYSPYQNGKQESFWGQVEGRLLAMLTGYKDLTLAELNEVTQAWVHGEYNSKVHSELGESPLARWKRSQSVGRASPSSDELRQAFMAQVHRTQRRSDGTVSLEGRRLEVPGRYRHLERVCLRYASWDLSQVYLVDERADRVLCRLYPQDKARNAQGVRRALASPDEPAAEPPAPPASPGMAPLLNKLLADYAATGLPPAYLPKDERQSHPEEETK